MPTVSEIELRRIREQVHSGNYFIYPKLSAGVILTAGAGSYTLGSYIEIIPVNTIVTTFYVMGSMVFDASSGVEYVIDIATGTAGSESDIGTLTFKYGSTGGEAGAFQNTAFQSDAFEVTAAQGVSIIPSQEPLFPVAIRIEKNTRISARLATSTSGYNCKLKIKYKI